MQVDPVHRWKDGGNASTRWAMGDDFGAGCGTGPISAASCSLRLSHDLDAGAAVGFRGNRYLLREITRYQNTLSYLLSFSLVLLSLYFLNFGWKNWGPLVEGLLKRGGNRYSGFLTERTTRKFASLLNRARWNSPTQHETKKTSDAITMMKSTKKWIFTLAILFVLSTEKPKRDKSLIRCLLKNVNLEFNGAST